MADSQAKTQDEGFTIVGAAPITRPAANDGGFGAVIESPESMAVKTFDEIGQVVGNSRKLAVSNFPADPMTRLKLVSKAMNGEALRMADEVGDVIPVEYWYVHTVDLCDARNGEIRTCPRTVFIDRDGNAHVAVSDGIAQAVEMLAKTIGPGDLPANLGAKVIHQGTQNKRKVLLIEWVDIDSED